MNQMEEGLLKYIKKEELTKIQEVKIGIAGCGGIGSNSAVNLIRLGFKHFLLVDFDKVEYSNLNRQFYFSNQVGMHKTTMLKDNLLQINPDAKIETLEAFIDKQNVEDTFDNCSLVIEGFDSVKYKKILIEELIPNKPVIGTSGLGDYWNVTDITIRKVNKQLTMVGDFVSDTDNGKSALSPGVSIAAGKVASTVLKSILGVNDD